MDNNIPTREITHLPMIPSLASDDLIMVLDVSDGKKARLTAVNSVSQTSPGGDDAYGEFAIAMAVAL